MNFTKNILFPLACYFGIGLIPHANSANTYAYLWGTTTSFSGLLDYNGPAISTITGKLNALNTGTMSVVYVDCATNSNVYVNYAASDKWVFIPQQISVAGKSVLLTPSPPAGFVNVGAINGYHIMVSQGDIYYSRVLGGCGTVGQTYPVNYTYPEISLTASVSGVPAGRYEGTIPVRIALSDHFGVTSADITKFSDSLAFSYSQVSNIPYSINITNACSFSPGNIEITHGELRANEGEGNTAKAKLVVNCTSDASLTLSLIAVTSPANQYADGIGVGLGDGWDASLTIDSTGISDLSQIKDVGVPANSELIIKSVLKKTSASTSTYGAFMGTAIMRVDMN
ncbi:hypothetical protein ZQ34_003982 [Salmonella enterica subsp. salamae]|nr:hypothetical protein [Salmonella enterica subsp. enterica serovar Everleigh]EDV1506041.1 hypothetical protein [Salmonella enterica subsp. salamae]EEI9684414.1 hypothetical protein [Salmonella enterica]ECD5051719.1 hypothetical protein [Salmonella enterica subsp. enterica serovar Everleigh]EED7441382.1 hypothetical protein [Salmonella enterica subsp. salamae]